MSASYRIPAAESTVETSISRSKFIGTVYNASSVEIARSLIAQRRAAMPDASHHVYAFRVGFGNSVNEGMSDDGEPSGTAGPPIMNVLRGSELGDTLIIVTRYFGGSLLGTGGLVRAYSEAAALALKACQTILKVEYVQLDILIDYQMFTLLKRLLPSSDATIVAESFSDGIELRVSVPVQNAGALTRAITELTAGNAVIQQVTNHSS